MKRYEALIVAEDNRLVRCPHCKADRFQISEQCRLSGKFNEYATCLVCGRGEWLEELQSIKEAA